MSRGYGGFLSEIYPDCRQAELDPVLLVMSTWYFTKQSHLNAPNLATIPDRHLEGENMQSMSPAYCVVMLAKLLYERDAAYST